MKWLPCSTCHDTALATKSGILHSMGTMHDSLVRYLCRRCGRGNTLTSQEFSRLPEMTSEEISSSACDLPLPHPEDDHPPSS